jgi:hypothetical protein
MTAPRNPDQLIRTYLIEDQAPGQSEVPDHIYAAIRDGIEHTRQRAVLGSTGVPVMNNNILRVGLAAAAVVVIAIIAINLLPGTPPPGGEPSVSPSVEPSEAPPSAEPSTAAGLPEGPHVLVSGQVDVSQNEIPPLTVTIPGPGWDGDVGGGILLKDFGSPDGAGMIVFAQQEYQVFGDPCSWETTPATTVTTVDEFIAALSSQASRDASEPVDITVDGYIGKAITLHVPDDADFSQCDQGTFGTWVCDDPANPTAQLPCGFVGVPGETSTEYIFDVEGALMAWHTSHGPSAPPDLVDEIEAIVQSASFGD